MVDIETNPLYYAAVGGIILGIATSLHYVLKGNVTGMSGIVFGIASVNKSNYRHYLRVTTWKIEYRWRNVRYCWHIF